MKEILAQHIIRRFGHRPDGLEQVLEVFSPVEIPRQFPLLNAGDVCGHVWFIAEGCLQMYVLDESGKESTREFFFEDYWITDIFGFQNQTPSTEYIRSVEPCRLLAIGYEDFQRLSQEIPPFSLMYRKMLESTYNSTIYRMNTLMTMPAIDRIRWLMDRHPGILSRLSSKLVASYLGVSPETLTRLKGQL